MSWAASTSQAGRIRPGRRAQGAVPGRLRRRDGLLRPQGRGGDRAGRPADYRRPLCGGAGESLLPPRPLRQGLLRRHACWAFWARSIPMWRATTAWTASCTPRSCASTRCMRCKGGKPVYQPAAQVPRRHPGHRRGVRQGRDRGRIWRRRIRKGAKGLLKDVTLFDIYTGTGIAPQARRAWPST